MLRAVRIATLLIALTLLPPGIAYAEMQVIGDDDRRTIDETGAPWASIGRVNRAGRAFCTGILITPRHVLTAAHCLYDLAQQRWAPASAIHFLVGYDRGEYTDEAAAQSYAIAEGYDRAQGAEMEAMRRDWAIVELARPLNAPPTPIWSMEFAGAAMALEDGILLQAGYSSDRPHILTVHEDCPLVGVTGGVPLFLHECDAVEGDSGSPLLLRFGDRFGVIGLHIARVESEGHDYGVAVPSEAFADSVRNWIGDHAVGSPPPLATPTGVIDP